MPDKVLVADDEEKIARMVGSYLEAAGFLVALAFDGARAISLFRSEAPDCLILDINMPKADGLEIAREVRKTSNAPIIFLTARTDEMDRIIGLELGADDYVSKPFSPRELVARVRAVLRRSSGGAFSVTPDQDAAPALLRQGDLELDSRKRSAIVSGRAVNLTAIQFDILGLLMREPGRVWTRLEILERAVGASYEGYERTVDAHIKNIRKAIGDDSDDPKYIGTMRGVGYRFLERSDEA
ncbi:MAG: response regulator transcription factor [Rectinemataceae bacterium]|jgi:DNA-binding response OmpR family regulator